MKDEKNLTLIEIIWVSVVVTMIMDIIIILSKNLITNYLLLKYGYNDVNISLLAIACATIVVGTVIFVKFTLNNTAKQQR